MKSKNQNLFSAIFLAVFSIICSNAHAQNSSDSKLRFGIGVDALAPLGNSTNAFSFALGVTPRLQYSLSDKVALTFTSGIYHFFTKTVYYTATPYNAAGSFKQKIDVIPAKFGVKFFTGSDFYLGLEAGATFYVSEGGGPAHFVAAPSVGYIIKHFDISARYENVTEQDFGSGMAGLRIAYGFY